MTFVMVDHWRGSGSTVARPAAPAASAWPRPAWAVRIERAHGGPVVARGLALAASAAIGVMVIAALAGFLDHATLVRALRDPLPLAVTLERLPQSEQTSGGAAKPVAEMAAATAQPSPVETSKPTPISRREWSVTRIPVVSPRPEAGDAGAAGAMDIGASSDGTGTGRGSNGAYDPYAGASPQRRTNRARLSPGGVDRAVLDAALAAVKKRYPDAHDRISMRVRLSPTGMVLEVKFDGRISPALAEALRDALVGQRIAVLESETDGGVTERSLPVLDLG